MLERLALHRPELRAWVAYDWANSVFFTTVIQLFPIYFATEVVTGVSMNVASRRFSIATTIGMVMIAVVAPILGAMADHAGLKKKMLATFTGIGCVSTAALYFVQKGDWMLGAALFIVGNIGVNGCIVFYDSLLPHVARPDEIDRVATTGFAFGYLGGGLLFAVNILAIQKPAWFGLDSATDAIRVSFLIAGLWWALFTIPIMTKVREPEVAPRPHDGRNLVTIGFSRLGQTLRDLRGYRNAFLFLLSFLIFSDGINTIIRMATIYGTEIGIERSALIKAILMVQFVGMPFSFLFGALAGRLGAKKAIFVAIAVYLVIAILAYRMQNARDFFVLAFLVATVQGGSQALSRSLFATLIPRHRSSEFYGFFGVSEKFGGTVGPAVFAAVVSATGSSRHATLALASFFLVGGAILAFVNVDEGRRTAREAEAREEAAAS